MAGIERSKLPDLIQAMDILGPVKNDVAAELGLRPGTPVIGGTPDVMSAGVGSGAVRDYEGHLYIGTSSWISCLVPFKKLRYRAQYRVFSPARSPAGISFFLNRNVLVSA